MSEDLVLYVLVRSDMESMNPGKAEAHSGHAANAFTDKYIIQPLLVKRKPDARVMDWRQQTKQGFGTQINLLCKSEMELMDIVSNALMMGYKADLVEDPTYAYAVSNEVANLISDEHDTHPRIVSGNKSVLFRRETTAGYVFGDRSEQGMNYLLGRLPLKP